METETVTSTTGSMRTALELRRGQNAGPNAPFTASHPRLKPCHLPLDGPFKTPAQAKSAANAWAHCGASNPEGTFRCRVQGTNAANTRRGKQFHIRCSKVDPPNRGGLSCPFDLKYEQVIDGSFRLAEANLFHADGCLQPHATAAERLAHGDFFIPDDLLEFAVRLASSGMTTGAVNDQVMFEAERKNLDITWRWDHLVSDKEK